jgi:hypothetical protein
LNSPPSFLVFVKGSEREKEGRGKGGRKEKRKTELF